MSNSRVEKGTQAGGDVTIALSDVFPSKIIIDAETSISNSKGSLAIKFRTTGMTKFKSLLNPDSGLPESIDASAPYPVVLTDIIIEELKFSPSNFAAGEVFTVSAHWR